MELKSLLYYRSKLDAHDQAIYDSLFQHWMHLEDNFYIKKPHCDFRTLITAVHFDNPILFYIDYYCVQYLNSPLGYFIKGGYLYSKDDAKAYLQQCEQWGHYIHQNIPAGQTVTNTALWLHDVILSNVKYGESKGMRAHNLVGVIADGEAVCEGIAMAYKYLCDLADIPCIFVSGDLNGEAHGWNLLWLDGGTSFVDVTNDLNGNGQFSRNHFLRKASEMHGYTWDETLIPTCNVYNASNASLTAHNKQELISILKQHGSLDSLSVKLDFGNRLSNDDINRLIAGCTIRVPSLFGRKISFSPDSQVVYFQ